MWLLFENFRRYIRNTSNCVIGNFEFDDDVALLTTSLKCAVEAVISYAAEVKDFGLT